MKVWAHTKFDGVHLGGVAVVVAPSAEAAAELLTAELIRQGLEQRYPVTAGQFTQLKTSQPVAVVLDNGDY